MKFVKLMLLLVCILCCMQADASEEAVKKGRALQNAKKYDEALQLYKTALKESPSEDLYTEAASLLGKLQKYDNAETILSKGLETYPKSVSLLNLQGLIKFRKGDKEAAKTIFEKVLSLDSNNSFAKKWLETATSGNQMPMDETDPESATSEGEPATSTAADDGSIYKVSSTLSKDEQLELAVKLYQEMMALEKWELDQFISLHRQVIEKCPLSHKAEESCWRLSNLYLLGQDPPDFENVIAVLEHLLKQYPETELLPDAKNRLMVVYQQTGQNEKLVALYEELFKRDPEPADDKTFMVRALEFGNALAAVGRTAEANAWYQKVIERDNGKDQLEARAAKDKLSGQN